MSFRSAPIIEQPIHKFACEKPEYLNQQARDYLDRVHWLPRFIVCRESATRSGNPFNKRITKAGKVKLFCALEKQLRFHARTANRRHDQIELNISFIKVFLRTESANSFIRLSENNSCAGPLPLTQIAQQRVQISENMLGVL